MDGESPAIIHVDPTEEDSMAIYRGAGRHRQVAAADAAALSVWAPAGPRAAIADCKCSRPSGRLRTRLSPRRRAAGPGKQDLGPNLHRHGVPAYHAWPGVACANAVPAADPWTCFTCCCSACVVASFAHTRAGPGKQDASFAEELASGPVTKGIAGTTVAQSWSRCY